MKYCTQSIVVFYWLVNKLLQNNYYIQMNPYIMQ
jgi:hypothetical protein